MALEEGGFFEIQGMQDSDIVMRCIIYRWWGGGGVAYCMVITLESIEGSTHTFPCLCYKETTNKQYLHKHQENKKYTASFTQYTNKGIMFSIVCHSYLPIVSNAFMCLK
jgi:hypothetical protein